MAKINVVDKAVVVTSGVKLADIEMVKKYRPAALTLLGGEDGKEPIFKLGTGSSGINKYGAAFDHANNEGYAVLTMVTDYDGENIKEYVADMFGEAITYLNTLEEKFPAVVAGVKAERDAILSNITIA